jgi:hypothetical protein
MKKMMILAVMMVMTISARSAMPLGSSKNAMSYTAAKNEALFLSDKMAYELNLTAAQYEAVYEINLDYLMSLNGHGDVFGIWWDRRNADLRFVLTPWQYDKYVALNHFYRPVAWKAGGWTFAVYSHYDRGHFYNAHPKVFVTYKGGHNRVHGSHYAHMHKPAPAPAMGHHNAPMHDKGARVMNDKGHMGNHRSTDGRLQGKNNAHKAPNREIAQNTRSNHGGSGHFGDRR